MMSFWVTTKPFFKGEKSEDSVVTRHLKHLETMMRLDDQAHCSLDVIPEPEGKSADGRHLWATKIYLKHHTSQGITYNIIIWMST